MSTFEWEAPLYDLRHGSASTLTQAILEITTKLTPILEKISGYLPNLTDHSIRHIENLRRLTNDFVPQNALTPVEVYCLNVAFLLHDACLSPELYANGVDGIRNLPLYKQLRAVLENIERRESCPNIDHTKDPVFFDALRHLHASRAEVLLGEFEPHLLSDPHLRNVTSKLCGPIAASHNWSREQLQKDLATEQQFPRLPWAKELAHEDLTLRPLYLALILRTVDACQVEGRAPSWSRMLQRPHGASLLHWDFQEDITHTSKAGAISFRVSAGRLDASKAPIWWMAYDYLRETVVPEIVSTTRLVQAHNYPSLKIARVDGLDSAETFARGNPTIGWEPVDIKATIRDPLTVVRGIGGAILYGKDPAVPIRELLQNALDACDARELKARQSDPDFSCQPIGIEVAVLQDKRISLSIQDAGIGMTEYVLREVLPDFGRSIWASYDQLTEAGSLISAGMRPRGRFGMGFFSVFMIADDVTITTKAFAEANLPAQVLEFKGGIGRRPLLRRASASEEACLKGFGTRVTLLLRPELSEYQFEALFEQSTSVQEVLSSQKSLVTLIERLAPVANRDISVTINGVNALVTQRSWEDFAKDWSLFRDRVLGAIPERFALDAHSEYLWSQMIRIDSSDGEFLGYLSPNLPASRGELHIHAPGVVADGGLRVQATHRYFGIATGSVETANRATAESRLAKVSKDSLRALAEKWKVILGYENGKFNLTRQKTMARKLRLAIASEFMAFDDTFCESFNLLQTRKTKKYEDWLKALKKTRRLAFFSPDLTNDEAVGVMFFGNAYQTESLGMFAKPSYIHREIYGKQGKTSLAHLLSLRLSRDCGFGVSYRFAKIHVGNKNRMKIFCYGVAFYEESGVLEGGSEMSDVLEDAWVHHYEPDVI